MSRISSELERQSVSDYYDLLLGEETGRYLFRIVALKEIMTHPKNYGFNFSFWDRGFGTYLKLSDEYHKKMTLGLESHQSINTNRLIWSLWLPFVKK